MAREDRLNEVYEYVRSHFPIHTQADFAEALKYNRAYISSAMHGNEKNLTDKLFRNICEAFPNVFNLDYLLTGKGSLLTIEEEVKSEDVEKMTNPTPTLDMSTYINALLAKCDETIASLKRELAAKDDIIQEKDVRIKEKDERIADLEKLAEERLHRIAELRRYIDENNISMTDHPFPIGVADDAKQSHKRV